MPKLLADRIYVAGDSIERFERAARRRFAEAELLRADADRHLAAIYLYGYSVEILLKAACYRVLGYAPGHKITKNDRKTVEALVQSHAPKGIPLGHYIPGWAGLLVARKISLDPSISVQVANRATVLYRCWRETFRSAPNRPSRQELDDVYETAAWFKKKYARILR